MGDKAGRGGHGAGMRRVLMLFVILAAVMGGEALVVVVMGRVVESEGGGKAEVVERESEALVGASLGAVLVAQSDIDGTTTWAGSYQADGRGTAEAGTVVERYLANGKVGAPTGLLNEGFRYRDMETGAFFSQDPLGLVDGPNVYGYMGQNPWTQWDPEGLVVGALVKRINERIPSLTSRTK